MEREHPEHSEEQGPSIQELAELCGGGPVLVATIGLPGSGKTTWAQRLLEEAPCFVRVNSDDIRAEHPRSHEAYIRRLRDEAIVRALRDGKSVVVDNTNLHGVSDLRRLAREGGAAFRVQDFRSVPWQEAVRRDAERAARGERATGRSVIIRMAMDAKLFELDPSVSREAVIIDLDGTLSDTSRRIHHLQGDGKKDWNAFFAEMEDDEVNRAVEALFHMARRAGYTVLLVSGRPDNYRIASERWLHKHGFEDYFALFLRPWNNQKPDTELKAEIYKRYIKPYFDVLFTVDDRQGVVDMWRAQGLVCFQVAPGEE